MPEGYGVPENENGLLDWSQVEQRLTRSDQYWMATTRPDGRPHVVPRWGVWLDGQLFYDGSPETVHVKNLEANPACALHLESGWEVVMIDGESHRSESPGIDLGARIAQAMNSKYGEKGYSPESDAWEGPDAGGLRIFRPQKAIAWFDFPNDLTRFRFSPKG